VSFLNQIVPAPKSPYLFPNQLLTKTSYRFPPDSSDRCLHVKQIIDIDNRMSPFLTACWRDVDLSPIVTIDVDLPFRGTKFPLPPSPASSPVLAAPELLLPTVREVTDSGVVSIMAIFTALPCSHMMAM